MADMLPCDRLEELWRLIDQQHLLYLELDESPRKIDQRDKLESYIKEYLYLAPHDRKFSLRQTAEVLHRSASTKDNFSGYRAALAWKAIGKYADNLVAQPWRKEYRDIKLYCGFYKHEIEESLVGAELMFEAMGYRHAGHSTMALPDILDPDRITSVSKDSIVAFVECQIMKQMWEVLSSRHAFTWLEILEFRENHTGTPDQAIKALTYKIRQRQYHEQAYHRPQQLRSAEVQTRPECMTYGQNVVGYYNHMHYPANHSYALPPLQSRYAPIVSPQQIVPPPIIYQTPVHPSYAPSHHIIKPQDLYPSNGYHMHYQQPVNPPHPVHNGYPVPHHPQMPMYTSTVPTGQLIELDSSPSHIDSHHTAEIHPRAVSTQKYHSKNSDEGNLRWHRIPEPVRIHDVQFPLGKAKDDGAGSWENWDYVYRNLESHGYKKDMGSRGDLLSPKGSHPNSASQNTGSNADITPSDVSEKFKKITIESTSPVVKHEPTKSIDREVQSLNKVRTEGDGEAKNKASKHFCESEVDGTKDHISTSRLSMIEAKSNRASPEKVQVRKDSTRRNLENVTVSAATNKSIVPNRFESEIETKLTVTLEVAPPAKPQAPPREPEKPKLKEPSCSPVPVAADSCEGKWECITCTYLNSPGRDICEMCCKSKKQGELKCQPTGGQECPQCTLVNEPKLTNCQACDAPLEHSPTYI